MPKPLILFVHGLGGDGLGTWGEFPELISSDIAICDHVDIAFYDYPTGVFRFGFLPQSLRI